jgi:ankyrin repeat protein
MPPQSPPRRALSACAEQHSQIDLSFERLFLNNRSDRPESPYAWMRALPPLARRLHQLSLSAWDDAACCRHALQVIRGGEKLSATDPCYGRTVLHWTCMLVRPALIELLLQCGAAAQLDCIDALGQSPLACVQASRIEAGASEIVELLLCAGASLTTLPFGGVELMYFDDLSVALVRRLLAAGVPVDGNRIADRDCSRNETPLVAACRHGLWPVALVLIEAGADVHALGRLGRSALHDPDIPEWLAERLLSSGAAADLEDELGATPLMLACSERNLPLARCLIDAGASTDRVSDADLRALGLRSRTNSVAAVMRAPSLRGDMQT